MSKKLQDVMSPEEIWNLIDEVEKASDDCTSQKLIDEMVRAAKEEAHVFKSLGKDRAEAVKEYYGHVKANAEEVFDVAVEEGAESEEGKSPEEMYHMYFPEFLGKSPEELSYIEASWYIEKSSYINKKAWQKSCGNGLANSDKEAMETYMPLIRWMHEISPRVHGRKTELKLKIPRVNTPLSEGVKPVRRFVSTKAAKDIVPKWKRSDLEEEVDEALSDLEKMFVETNDGITRVPPVVRTKGGKKDVEPENVEVVETEEKAAPVANEVIFRAFQEKDKTFLDKIGDSITALVDWMFGWWK